jgi:hypothetical protein
MSNKEIDNWLEMQYSPELVKDKLGVILPLIPSDDIQLRFNGKTTKENLEKAFSFYNFLLDKADIESMDNPSIMDFGAGWGRHLRFFLINTQCNNLWAIDCLSDSIKLLKETNFPGNIVNNSALPPINEVTREKFDLIYAHSVFSHLAESSFIKWTVYLLTLLKGNGTLIYTTRGTEFINYVEKMEIDQQYWYGSKFLPDSKIIRNKFSEGEFQFYQTGGGGELLKSFYGETFIPRNYIMEHHKEYSVEIYECLENIDQTVVVVRK